MRRRQVALLGRLSMAAGSLLIIVGLSIRGGVLDVVAGGAPPSAVPSPSPMAVTAAPSPAGTTSPPAEPTTVFEDTFEAGGAWPTGELGDMLAAYGTGTYAVSGPRADLPVFIAPVAEPLAAGSRVVVEAELTLEPGAQAGVYVGAIDAARIGALIGADGRVTIVRDSSVALDVIGSGSVAADGPPRLTLTVDGAAATVAVDGRPAVTVALPATALDFGIVVWPTGDSAVSVARFTVMVSPAD